MSRRAWAAALIAVSWGMAACGDDDGGTGSSLVDPNKDPPIHSFAVEPGSGDLLLTTNRGFFRVREGKAKRVEGKVDTQDGVSPVGNFLVVRPVGEGRFVGSGHPDRKERLAEFLGFMRSDDGGKTWMQGTRYGIGDLHVIRSAHGRVYAVDAVLGGVIVSEDRGQDWLEWPTPPGVLDMVVDPEDPDYLLISSERELFRSEDAGETWRPLGSAPSARLAWPAPGRLYRADDNGRVYLSDDRGESWADTGSIDGEPWKLEPDGDRLLAVLSDATIVGSDDGGESWDPVFEP